MSVLKISFGQNQNMHIKVDTFRFSSVAQKTELFLPVHSDNYLCESLKRRKSWQLINKVFLNWTGLRRGFVKQAELMNPVCKCSMEMCIFILYLSVYTVLLCFPLMSFISEGVWNIPDHDETTAAVAVNVQWSVLQIISFYTLQFWAGQFAFITFGVWIKEETHPALSSLRIQLRVNQWHFKEKKEQARKKVSQFYSPPWVR